MKQFNYIAPQNIKEALARLEKEKNALVIGGGTDLLALIKLEIANPEVLIDISNLNLNYIEEDEIGLHIGASTTLSEILNNKLIQEKYSLLYKTIKEIASAQIRNRATIAGSILQRPRCFYFRGPFKCFRKKGNKCYAVNGNNKYHCIIGGGPCYIVHPSDAACALMALKANLAIKSLKRENVISINEFFVLPKINFTKENILKSNEIISEIIIPRNYEGAKSSFVKVRERKGIDFGLMSVAILKYFDNNKKDNYSIVIGGIAPMPWRAISAEDILQSGLSSKKIASAAEKILQEAHPLSDNLYKMQMLKGILAEALEVLD